MNRLKFIANLISKGFSWKSAVVASMFVLCCQDYRWLARRSRKTLCALIKKVKKRYGTSAYKLAGQLKDRPDVQAFLLETWDTIMAPNSLRTQKGK